MNETKIDIVIPWVDPTDPIWVEDKNKFSTSNHDDNREIRYRDWDNLKYVFRSIEQFAPWVNKVHFITYGHLPEWLNADCPKLNIVYHEDYIPEKYLPTFNSHTIELNLNRIESLSEQFIYFNDDIFLLKPVKPSDFFKNGKPRDVNIPSLVIPSFVTFSPNVFNSVAVINKYFDKHQIIKHNPLKYFNFKYGLIGFIRCIMFFPWPYYTGFYVHHLSNSYLKSTLDEVWERESELLDESCSHRFRNHNDVNQYVFRFWQLASDTFFPGTINGKFFKVGNNNEKLLRYIRKQKGKMICINDGDQIDDFNRAKTDINTTLKQLFPNKCCFEL